jgi:hypothetical protein
VSCYDCDQLRNELRKILPPCSECGERTALYKPVFGALAPEWWASMRERGIDPSTGHKTTCLKAKP